MRKLFILSLILLLISGCTRQEETPEGCDLFEDCAVPLPEEAGLTFKEKYEGVNGTTNASGKENRSVTIDEDHPFVKEEPAIIVNKIENKETFYLYVGDEQCPWCRSVIETAIRVAKEEGIKEIYYLEIWNADGEEILRDKYVVQEGKLVKESSGHSTYTKLLTYLHPLLDDYIITQDDQDYEVNEKRIYAPNFFYIEDGVPKKMTTGISGLQEDSRQELNEEMLKEEETLFKEFFAK